MTGGEQQSLEQALAEWTESHEHVDPSNDGMLHLIETAGGLFVVSLALDWLAGHSDWVKRKPIEFMGLCSFAYMTVAWVVVSRDPVMLEHYIAKALGIAYGTTWAHFRTKPHNWDEEPDPDETGATIIRRYIRGGKVKK